MSTISSWVLPSEGWLKVRLRLVPALGAAAVLLATTFFAAEGCVDLTPNTVQCPPFADFKAVSPLMEKRCGTLDWLLVALCTSASTRLPQTGT